MAACLSCDQVLVPDEPDDISGISLNKVEEDVEYTSAIVFGTIRVNRNPERISEVRVYYGTASDALTKSVKAAFDVENGFSAVITSLEDGALYFYRVDIIVGKTPIEGKIQEFITFPKGPVDLDLPSGIKWASHSVGAKTPTEPGGYFAWGETEEKTQYDWTTYKYANGAYNKLTKYTLKASHSNDKTTDNQVELLPEDDVATKTLGEHYCTPSYQDWKELIDNCEIKSATINGVKGVKVMSKKDKNNTKKFIFLSGESGYYEGTRRESGSSYYWSSTLNSDLDYSALNGHVISSLSLNTSSGNRCLGESIRAINK